MFYNLLTLARLLNLSDDQVAVLPACVERMGQSVGMTVGQFSTQCLGNVALRDYLGEVVRKVANTAEGKEVAGAVVGK